MTLLRFLAATLVLSAFLPTSAWADAQVDRNGTGIITITDFDGTADDITVTTVGATRVITSPTGLLPGSCSGGGASVTCTVGTSIAA